MTTKTKSKIRAFGSKNLRKHPYVQAAAASLVAQMQMTRDIDDKEHDAIPQVAWEVCFQALGLSEGDPREGEVADAINELAFEMEAVLTKKGLLRKDCPQNGQEQRAA
jgi:hypothetical protein